MVKDAYFRHYYYSHSKFLDGCRQAGEPIGSFMLRASKVARTTCAVAGASTWCAVVDAAACMTERTRARDDARALGGRFT